MFARVYDEVRRIAHGQIARLIDGQAILNTTAVVHEAYLKLVRSPALAWEDRGHFYAVAATAMRQVLLNHARSRRAKKRGGGAVEAWSSTSDLAADAGVDTRIERFLELDAALTKLRAADERLAQVVDLRFFAGLSVEETAAALGVTDRTVKRDWRMARAFLFRELGTEVS